VRGRVLVASAAETVQESDSEIVGKRMKASQWSEHPAGFRDRTVHRSTVLCIASFGVTQQTVIA